MAALRLITLFLALGVTSAHANTCIIVVPTDQVGDHYSPRIVRIHEEAHCKGYSHIDGTGQVPPAKWQRMSMPKGMKLEVMRVPTSTAKLICNAMSHNHLDSYGCQWFDQ